MTRSLRTRFFLTVWPLIVAALATVGVLLGRWTREELHAFERVDGADALEGVRARLADSAAASWEALRRGGEPVRRLRHLAMLGGLDAHLVLLDSAGTLLVTTDPDGRPGDARLLAGGALELTRSRAGGVLHDVSVLRVRGTPVVRGGRALGHLFVVVRQQAGGWEPTPGTRSLVDEARRTIWTTVLLASLAAALATMLLARPLVGQVARLADAARRIRGGALDTRVRVSSADELGELERSFNAMAESLERAAAQQRRIVSDVAHELRTPLTNVVGLLEAMRDGLRTPDAETLDSAREEAALLHALVGELQELSVAESGGMRFDLEPLDAAEEARRAVAACLLVPTGVAVRGPANAEATPMRADRRRVAQVLRNLLRNAVAYTPAGGLVRVEVEHTGAAVVIRVVDTGTGIGAEHLPHVWERFYRVDPSRSRATGGMGLGLAVVRHLVEGMGGRVWAESTPGRGSTFAVALPAVDDPERRPRRAV